jgi:hypothetical protein
MQKSKFKVKSKKFKVQKLFFRHSEPACAGRRSEESLFPLDWRAGEIPHFAALRSE